MQAKGKGLEGRTARFKARIVNVCEATPQARLKGGHLQPEGPSPRIEGPRGLPRMTGTSVPAARLKM